MKKDFIKIIIHNRNFLKIWISQILSLTTVNLVNFLIILRIFEHTHSSVAVSLVFIFWAIPAIIVGPFSGVIVDLVNKRKILIATNLIQAFIILMYLGVRNWVWPLYFVVFLYSLINQFYVPSESSSLPLLVEKKFYPVANSIFMFSNNLAFLVGYTLAGPLLRLFGRDVPYILGFIFLLIAAFSVYLLPKNYSKEIIVQPNWEEFFQSLKEGYVFIKNSRFVLFPILLIAIVQIILNIMAILVPIYADKILKIDLRDAALVLITPAGLGALFGVRVVVNSLIKKVRKNVLIKNGLFISALGFLLLATLVPNLKNMQILACLIIIFVLGVGFSLIFIPSQTLIQENTPKQIYGRVFSVLAFIITACSLMPLMFSATIADILGIKWTMFLIFVTVGFVFYLSINYKYKKVYEK